MDNCGTEVRPIVREDGCIVRESTRVGSIGNGGGSHDGGFIGRSEQWIDSRVEVFFREVGIIASTP